MQLYKELLKQIAGQMYYEQLEEDLKYLDESYKRYEMLRQAFIEFGSESYLELLGEITKTKNKIQELIKEYERIQDLQEIFTAVFGENINRDTAITVLIYVYVDEIRKNKH